ncbi:MAG: L-threonylcarbamoyladenylate synthase [Alkalilacustris sp.]
MPPAPSPTLRLPVTEAGLDTAARLLAEGALVAFPTETVYGLGADARNPAAVAAIYAAKGRPQFNPLIVHVPDIEAARRLAVFDPLAERLAAAFWPGPLTLVLPGRGGIAELATAGLPSVALRIPAHPTARALLARAGVPVAAPSANPSGRISPTTADHVLQGLDGRIAAVLDAGPCAVGVESTILALTKGAPRLLRPGGLPAEALADLLGAPLGDFPGARPSDAPGDAPRDPTHDPADAPPQATAPLAPGMLASHYAPAAALRLAPEGPAPGEVWIGFGPDPACAADALARLSLSPDADLSEAATQLFATLREADALAGPGGRIAARPVPDHGLGRAINDRLRRAAAPRPPTA